MGEPGNITLPLKALKYYSILADYLKYVTKTMWPATLKTESLLEEDKTPVAFFHEVDWLKRELTYPSRDSFKIPTVLKECHVRWLIEKHKSVGVAVTALFMDSLSYAFLSTTGEEARSCGSGTEDAKDLDAAIRMVRRVEDWNWKALSEPSPMSGNTFVDEADDYRKKMVGRYAEELERVLKDGKLLNGRMNDLWHEPGYTDGTEDFEALWRGLWERVPQQTLDVGFLPTCLHKREPFENKDWAASIQTKSRKHIGWFNYYLQMAIERYFITGGDFACKGGQIKTVKVAGSILPVTLGVNGAVMGSLYVFTRYLQELPEGCYDELRRIAKKLLPETTRIVSGLSVDRLHQDIALSTGITKSLSEFGQSLVNALSRATSAYVRLRPTAVYFEEGMTRRANRGDCNSNCEFRKRNEKCPYERRIGDTLDLLRNEKYGGQPDHLVQTMKQEDVRHLLTCTVGCSNQTVIRPQMKEPWACEIQPLAAKGGTQSPQDAPGLLLPFQSAALVPLIMRRNQSETRDHCLGVLEFFFRDNDEQLKALKVPLLLTLSSACSTYATVRQGITAVRKAGEKMELAALMARNLSHNMGSHVLASSLLQDVRSKPEDTLCPEACKASGLMDEKGNIKKGTDLKKLVDSLSRSLDGYIQQRTDFISQIVEGATAFAEPLLFWQDVVRPFTKQYVLLATLLDDQGFGYGKKEGTRPIRFVVKLPGFETANEKEGNGLHTVWGRDVLIGMPAGLSGTHALYSIIENLLRNAAKYGVGREKSDAILTMEMWLVEDTLRGRYVLEIRESLGSDGEGDLTATEQRTVVKLRSVLCSLEGKPTKEGQGTREVRACAAFLAGDKDVSLWFASDDDEVNSQEASEYRKYLVKNGSQLSEPEPGEDGNAAWFREKTPVRCWHDGKGIVYALVLPRPRLLGLIDAKRTPDIGLREQLPYTRVTACVKDLAKCSPFFGVVLDRNASATEAKAVLRNVLQEESVLPFRLFCVCPEGGDTVWQQVLNRVSSDTPWVRKRFRVIADQDLYDRLRENPSDMSSKDDIWRNVLKKCYVTWLRAFKPPETVNAKKWLLLVGFERDRHADEGNRWSVVRGFSSEIIDIHVLAKTENRENALGSTLPKGMQERFDTLKQTLKKKACIVFDNHGKLFTRDEAGYGSPYAGDYFAFWQEISGNESIGLYQELESPPSNEFAFHWFVHSLVEGALLKVAVFDERLAQSNVNWKCMRTEQQTTRVYPLFGIRGDTGMAFASKGINANEDVLCLTANGSVGVHIRNVFVKNAPLCLSEDLDILVVHLGLMEQSASIAGLSDRSHQLLLHLGGARLVVTSGRGSGGRTWGQGAPFAEFAAVGQALYIDRNKHHLARVLLNARAEELVQ